MRELAQLGGCLLSLVERLGHERRRLVVPLLERLARQLQRDDRLHQALLRSVVQIAYHPPPLLVARRHDPRP